MKRSNNFIEYEKKAVCPGIDIEYKIENWKPGAHTLTVTNGDADGDVSADGEIKIFWYDTGDACKIKVTACQNCDSVAPTKEFTIPVLSLKKTLPMITQDPPERIVVGFTKTIKYTAKANYPLLGTEDDKEESPFLLDYFYWKLPSNWTINTVPNDVPTITVTTDIGTGGNVMVQARNNACPVQEKSDTAIFNVQRKMPSICPVVSATRPYELCGESIVNTFNCAGLPLNFTSPPNGVIYSWSVSPADGWLKIGELGNTAQFKTDGQKDRTVRVIATAYGVSDTCTVFVPLRVANPATQVTGPNTLCSNGTYKLTIDPPNATTTTWQVTSLTLGSVLPVTPLSGTGSSAMLSLVSGSANCMITFTITGCGKTTILRDTFFAGKPIIANMTIDGQQTSSSVVCRGGYHYMSASVFGVSGPNVCMQWVSVYGQPLVITCNTAQVFMPENSGLPVVAKVTATNECGSTEAHFYLWPGPKCGGQPGFAVVISPNPATDMISVQVRNEETMVIGEDPIKELYIINQFGSIVSSNTSTQTLYQLQIGQIPEGLYTVRARVGNEMITTSLVIKRE